MHRSAQLALLLALAALAGAYWLFFHAARRIAVPATARPRPATESASAGWIPR